MLTAAVVVHADDNKLRYGDRPLSEYTIDQALRLPAYAHPEWVQAIQKLIEDHPDHPRVGELRYFAEIQWLGTQLRDAKGKEQEADARRRAITRLDALTKSEGFKSAAGYKSQLRIGHMYQHYFDQPADAYLLYLKLVDHPFIKSKEINLTGRPSDDEAVLERDLRRIELYERIAATASRTRRVPKEERDNIGDEQLVNDIEQFSRLVLEYPYWKGPALRTTYRQTLYRGFYDAHGSAASCFISTFRDDYHKLESILIVHHRYQIENRRRYMDEALERGNVE